MDEQFKIGHYTDKKNITGCTVILCPQDTTASCTVSGSAPGSRETALLAPDKKIDKVNGLLLTGGSAFGLNAAAGVMKYLEETGRGYQTLFGIVPIVPAAVIYDLNIGSSAIRPVAENAYQACVEAGDNFDIQGSVGAGTGATVGKWLGLSNGMKGGIGIKTLTLNNLFVRAITVVNAVGDIVDENGNIIAGARAADGNMAAQDDRSLRWKQPQTGFTENTVLSAILTNARLTKLEANILSQRAQNGLARAIIPVSTSYDGDVTFALASGRQEHPPDVVYELATEAMRMAVVNGVTNAESLGGIIAAKNPSQ